MGRTSVSAAELRSRVSEVLAQFRATPEARARATRWIIQAEQLELPAFGIELLARDLDDLARVSLGDSALPHTDNLDVSRATHRIDGSAVPGVLALAQSVDVAGTLASRTGIGAVSLHGVRGLGILGFAARELAEQNLVGVLLAHSPAIVAPWGGSSPAVGTNPIAVGVPREGEPPLVFDYATSQLTMAQLRHARDTGEPIPDDAAVIDPATGAATILAGNQVASLTALTVELLAGVLTGSRLPASQSRSASGRGALLLAIQPEEGIARHTSQLVRDWRDAGGHVPARFDRLPGHDALADPTPDLIELSDRSLEALERVRRQGARS